MPRLKPDALESYVKDRSDEWGDQDDYGRPEYEPSYNGEHGDEYSGMGADVDEWVESIRSDLLCSWDYGR